jgi:hypothetical protein
MRLSATRLLCCVYTSLHLWRYLSTPLYTVCVYTSLMYRDFSGNKSICLFCRFGEFVIVVVRDMIVPNCVWKAGRTAAAIRKAAVACLWALVKSRLLTRDQV